MLTGERDWLEDDAGAVNAVDEEAAESFWVWADLHSNATCLELRDGAFARPKFAGLSREFLQKLEDLRLVRCQGVFASVEPLLIGLKTILLEADGDDADVELLVTLARPEGVPFGHLQRLKTMWFQGPADLIFARFPLPNLSKLTLHIDGSTARLEQALPTLTNLRSLKLASTEDP